VHCQAKVAKVLVADLRDGLDIQEANDPLNILDRNGQTELEHDRLVLGY
jgi:hypothetical protein